MNRAVIISLLAVLSNTANAAGDTEETSRPLTLEEAYSLEMERSQTPTYLSLEETYRAAEQADAHAQFILGLTHYISAQSVVLRRRNSYANAGRMLYYWRDGGKAWEQAEYAESAKWYHLAAKQGHAEAQYLLADMYAEGLYGTGNSGKQDRISAAEWYRRAADQGCLNALGRLSVIYREGSGVPLDYIEAYKWASIASEKGDELFKFDLNWLTKRMSPPQVAEAQRRTRDWRPNPSAVSPETPGRPPCYMG